MVRRDLQNRPPCYKLIPEERGVRQVYLQTGASIWPSIYPHTKLHKRAPAELDIQRYFQVTPPSVHQMILTLETRGLISRIPWTPRSIQVLVPKDELPELD